MTNDDEYIAWCRDRCQEHLHLAATYSVGAEITDAQWRNETHAYRTWAVTFAAAGEPIPPKPVPSTPIAERPMSVAKVRATLEQLQRVQPDQPDPELAGRPR